MNMPGAIFNFRLKGSTFKGSGVRKQKTENLKVGQLSAAAKSQWTAARIKNL